MTLSHADFVAQKFPAKPPGSYLDTASIGLVPDAVRTAVADCYAALGAGATGMTRNRSAVARTRELLAQEFGRTPEDITFTSSTGEAINAIARAIQWRDGDTVLVLEDEFPTTSLPWSRIPGVRLVTVPPGNNDDRSGALLAALDERTRLVAVSHVNSATGTTIDLAALGAACARSGTMLLCDAAQSAGAIPVDARDLDFFVATGYKWLLAGFGIAFTITGPAVREHLSPTLLGHANIPPSAELAVGTQNLGGIRALGAASLVRREFGLTTATGRARALADRVRKEADALGYRVAAHDTLSTVVSLVTPAAEAIVAQLRRRGIVVAERGGCIRISPHFYTTATEIDALVDALSTTKEQLN